MTHRTNTQGEAVYLPPPVTWFLTAWYSCRTMNVSIRQGRQDEDHGPFPTPTQTLTYPEAKAHTLCQLHELFRALLNTFVLSFLQVLGPKPLRTTLGRARRAKGDEKNWSTASKGTLKTQQSTARPASYPAPAYRDTFVEALLHQVVVHFQAVLHLLFLQVLDEFRLLVVRDRAERVRHFFVCAGLIIATRMIWAESTRRFPSVIPFVQLN